MEEKVPAREVFAIAMYLLTSARGCLDEPKLYGPLRLLEVISRLASLSEHAGTIEKDEFLVQAKSKIDMNKHLVMESEDDFAGFLDALITEFTQELKRRSGIK